MASSPLLKLPQELILRCSDHLSTKDLGAFRQSCKQVETSLFDSFAKEFFSKRQFMIEEISLEALVGIANHKTLAPYLTEVIVSLDVFDNVNSYSYDQIDRQTLLATGIARDMLSEAFSKLPNLRCVGLRDYNGRGRYREGPDGMWRSYGWTLGKYGDGSTSSVPSQGPPNAILPLILFALGKASVHSKVERLEVFLRRRRVPDSSFDLRSRHVQPHLIPVLSGLRKLLLSLYDDVPFSNSSRGFKNLRSFLRHTPLLEHLRLNFSSQEDPMGNVQKFIHWFGNPLPIDASLWADTIKLDHLVTLDLGMLGVRADSLLAIVSKFTKLQSLSLWKVNLVPNNSSVISDQEAGNAWSRLLAAFSTALASRDFDTFMVGWATESSSPRPVKFAGEISIDGNGKKHYKDVKSTVSFRKQADGDVCQWLEKLSKSVYVDESDGDSDSDDSDSDASDGDDSIGSGEGGDIEDDMSESSSTGIE